MHIENIKKIEGLLNSLSTVFTLQDLPDAVMFGSSAIALNGCDLGRDIDDLDIFISQETFNKLIGKGFQVYLKANEIPYITGELEKIEIFKEFDGMDHSKVLSNSSLKNSPMPVASLEDLKKWKKIKNRPKDVADLERMRDYSMR